MQELFEAATRIVHRLVHGYMSNIELNLFYEQVVDLTSNGKSNPCVLRTGMLRLSVVTTRTQRNHSMCSRGSAEDTFKC